MSESRSNSRRVIKVKLDGGVGALGGNVTVVNQPTVNIGNTPDVNVVNKPTVIPVGIYDNEPTLAIDSEHNLRMDEAGRLIVTDPTREYIYNKYVAATSLGSVVLSNTYQKVGNAINTRGYTHMGLFFECIANNSKDVVVEVFAKTSSGATKLFTMQGGMLNLWNSVVDTPNMYYLVDLQAAQGIEVHIKAGTIGITPGDVTVSYNLMWR